MGDRRMGVADRAEAVLLVCAAAHEKDFVAPGGKAVRERVIRLQLERALEQRQRLRGPVRNRRIDQRNGTEDEIVGVEIVRALTLDALDLRLAQARLDGGDYAHRELVLEREDVVEGAVVALRPDVSPGFRLDDLTGNAHTA